jgi:uncharacterized hydrophobic protein (TIGR00341 family)
MRLIQLTIKQNKREAVVDLLDERGLTYALTDETSEEGGVIVSVPVETDAVEEFLDALRGIGVERDGYAVVSDIEAVLSESIEKTEGDKDTDNGTLSSNRISRDELQAQATDMAALTPNYIFFTVVSAIVAAAGLLTDSAAVVVGSMVIAPLLGPAVGASVGSQEKSSISRIQQISDLRDIVNDDELFRESVKSQLVGLVLAVISGAVFAYLVKFTIMPSVDLQALSEVASRVNPGALALVVALGSGAAGAFSLSTGESAPLVGVMIAAALIPPAAAIGLGIAYWSPILIISVSILVLVNVLSINFASLGVLWLRGYRPSHWFEQEVAKKVTVKRLGILVVGIIVLSSFLVVTTLDLQRNAQFETTVEDVAAESDVRILSLDISYETQLFSRQPEVVTVHAVTETERAADRLRQRIKDETGLDVSVVVVRETVETASSPRQTISTSPHIWTNDQTV